MDRKNQTQFHKFKEVAKVQIYRIASVIIVTVVTISFASEKKRIEISTRNMKFHGIEIKGEIDSSEVQSIVDQNIDLVDKNIIEIELWALTSQDSTTHTKTLHIKTWQKQGAAGWSYFFEKKDGWVKKDSALWME